MLVSNRMLISSRIRCWRLNVFPGQNRPMSRVIYFLSAFALTTAICLAAEWRQFRGPDGQGHTDAKELPLTWSEAENVRWKTAIPGRGWSSPVFDGDIVWMTTAVEDPLTGEALEKVQREKLANDLAGLCLAQSCQRRHQNRQTAVRH
jgi:hypothetical protein